MTAISVSEQDSGFLSPQWFEILKGELSDFSGTIEYAEMERYYQSARKGFKAEEKVVPVILFGDALDSLIQQQGESVTPEAKRLHDEVERYTQRLTETVYMLSPVAEPVPAIMHFVWVGGSEVGASQRDYMNIWRQILASEGYKFNLWYDSDALLAFEMNRVILDSARTHAMESGGDQVRIPDELAQRIESRARVLKLQMADFLAQPEWAGRADEARIELMAKAYGKDRAVLEAFRQHCLDTHLAMTGPDLNVRDVRETFADHFLKDVYQREIALRGNFAAASDVVRLQALHLEGGRYSDMDYLPPLIDMPGGVDISGFEAEARLGVLQLLLNHDVGLMPGREPQRYDDRTDRIPAEHFDALLDFARSRPGADKIFTAPSEHTVPPDGIRLGTAHGSANTGEMNAHMLAHPGSGMTDSIMRMIRFNYDCLFEVERRVINAGMDPADTNGLQDVVISVLAEQESKGVFTGTLGKLAEAIATYYQDGIRIGARGTITLTGPGAAANGMTSYTREKLLPEYLEAVRGRLKLVEGYNVYTEEEMISGWTVNGSPEKWLEKEKDKWTGGKLKSRYAGKLSELLNEQTLTFKRGWPVIEGKPVLSTAILQHLLDQLGRPFYSIMNDRLSGEFRFNKRISLSFEQRQQIAEQPETELPISIGARALENLNEELTLIAAGKLPVDQLSPLHRVVFGELFGAQSLDDEGFASTWEAVSVFASETADRGYAGRYERIEQMLRERKSPAFEAGLKRGRESPSNNMRTAAIKALALAEPLSTRQWGRRVGEVESVARDEYRSAILRHAARVREGMFKSGATSAQQLPQSLLMRGEGDPGRRCYPLALTMSAALEKGFAAQRTLSGRLANAGVAVEDPETSVLLRTLDDLRSVPMAEFGNKHGEVSLATVMATLKMKDVGASLMINTANHSMLVAKVRVQGRVNWYFYDPNFGLYGFHRLDALQQGIERFLADRSIADIYGIYEGVQTPFNLIELDGARIADRLLPSQTRVGDLLSPQPDGESRTVEPWQHHATLRTRALSENARLGQGIARMEGEHWAQVIESATRELSAKNILKRGFVPVYETVEPSADGQWTMSLVNRHDSSDVVQATVKDSRWIKIRNWLGERFKALAIPPEGAPHEPASVNTLNVGFTILALMHNLRQHESSQTDEVPMTLAVRLHSYVVYGQMLHGVAVDAAALMKLVNQALQDERVIAAASSSQLKSLVGRLAGEGLGTLLMLINVGFDIYELAHADNEATRAATAVQLSFDVAGLALAGTAAFAGGTTAAVAGPLAVVLGGIAYGVGALAQNYLQNLQRAQQVGEYFYRLKSAVSAGGFSVESGVFQPRPETVIRTVDLQRREVILSSHFLFRGLRSGPGLPSYNDDFDEAINVNQRWNLPSVAPIDMPFQTLVLPCTPTCYYGYDYQLMPGATHRHDQGFDEMRELEHDEQGERTFWFDPWTPFEYVVYRLYPVYKKTLVEIVLDTQCRSLLVPNLPEEWHGKISYDIEGEQGQYSLALSQRVHSVELLSRNDPAAVQWLLRAAWASDTQVSLEAEALWIDGISVAVSAQSELLLVVGKGQVFRVDWSERQLILVEEDVDGHRDFLALTERLVRLDKEHRLASPYLPLHHVEVPFTDPQWPVNTNAFFDAARQRIVYARDLPGNANAQVQLGAVMGKEAYFYHEQYATIWCVDVLTGKVQRRYRLLNPRKGARVVACHGEDGVIRITQEVEGPDLVIYQFDYLLRSTLVELNSVSVALVEGKHSIVKDIHWPGWDAFLQLFDVSDEGYDDDSAAMRGDVEKWNRAPFVSMQVHLADQTLQAWLRTRDERFVSGPTLGLKDVVLLASHHDEDSGSLFFYEPQSKKIWQWMLDANEGRGALLTSLANVGSVVSLKEGFLAQTLDGLVFEVGADRVVLRSLTEQWLPNLANGWSALTRLAETHQVDAFDIVGLSDAHGEPLAARYLDGKVLLIGGENGRHLVTVAQTPDRKAAWLFSPDTGRILRQALMTPDDLGRLFGAGHQVRKGQSVVVPETLWQSFSFERVSAFASGLMGWTRDGVILELLDGEAASFVGVEPVFASLYDNQRLKEKITGLITGQRHPLFLTAGHSNGWFRWFDTLEQQAVSTNARLDDQWVDYLGRLSDDSFLFYDPIDHALFSSDRKIFTNEHHVIRDASVLTIMGRGRLIGLLPILPNVVDTLVLVPGAERMSCEVQAPDWQRLTCIVVDCSLLGILETMEPFELALKIKGIDGWFCNAVNTDLLLTDPDNGHTLVLRGALALNLSRQAKVSLILNVAGDYQKVDLEELINFRESSSAIELGELLVTANEV